MRADGGPVKATGLVKRDVIRVMTPGTVIESNMLEDGANNYLCAIYKNADRSKAGLCFADVSTGEFHITSLNTAPLQRQIMNELYTYMPREIIVNNDAFMNCMGLSVLMVRSRAEEPTGAQYFLKQLNKGIELKYVDDGNTCGSFYYSEYTESYEEIGPAHIFHMDLQGEGYRARQLLTMGL